MGTQIVLELTDSQYRRAKQLAGAQHQDVPMMLTALLTGALSVAKDDYIDWSEPDTAVERERDAFIAMHPMLKERYSDQYVAIHHGALIDHDHDYTALYARIDHAYPDEFVWLSAVTDEPLPTILQRSPRLIRDH